MRLATYLGSALLWAQTLYLDENFNSGSTPTGWTLNSSDLGGATPPYNRWVVDAPYTANHTQTSANPAFCQLNAPQYCQAATGPTAPAQPTGITGAPQSHFMYISFDPTWGTPTPACSPALTTPLLYISPTNMFPCYPQQSSFTKTSPISIPAGTQPIKLSFFWLCQGGPSAYGEVYYSTDGTTWTQLTSRNGNTQFLGQSNWYADTITLPISRPATVYIGFRFVNNSDPNGTGSEPPFGVDEVRVWEPGSSGPQPVTITLAPPVSTVCAGSGLNVSFSTSGTFGSGNTFSVELSDASGSFANPTVLGSGTSSPIACVIPSSLPSGTYRVRVASSNPTATSNDEPITVIGLSGLTCDASPNPATPGSVVTFTIGGTGLPNGPFSITWDPDDGSGAQTATAASLPTTFTHTYANQGGYAVSFRVTHTASGCFNDCAVPLTISTSSSLPKVTYAEGHLYLYGVREAWVELYDSQGRCLYRGAASAPIPMRNQTVYLLRVITETDSHVVRGMTP